MLVVNAYSASKSDTREGIQRVSMPDGHHFVPGLGQTAAMNSRLGQFGALWGILGVVTLLLFAVYRLSPIAGAGLQASTEMVHWIGIIGSLIFFAYAEGYRAFQKQFSPRVVVRAFSLLKQPTFLRVLLAPPFAMGFFGATRKRMIVSWCLTAGIIVLIVLVGKLSQPWRGIIDLGVVVALLWGTAAIIIFAVRALLGYPLDIPADLPDTDLLPSQQPEMTPAESSL